MMFMKFAMPLFVGALAVLPVACAPQPTSMAAPAPAASLSGPANASQAATPMPGMTGPGMTGPGMTGPSMAGPGMAGMDHSNTQGMDMNTMMARCAQMRQQMRPGMAMSADMRQMMGQCDQMDRSTAMPAPRAR
jgi:hypothetical protein